MFRIIGYIWNNVWAVVSWLRNAFLNLIFLLIVVLIIIGIATAPKPQVPDQIALNITPQGYLVDQRTYQATPADVLLGTDDQVQETLLRELVDTVKMAAEDKRITAMVLNLTQFAGGGISKMEELGQALEVFKAQGKPIYAYGDDLSQQQYFLASYADTIYLNDMGSVLLTGFGMYQSYFKEAADKLSVQFHVFRVGEYKDAVEPFMRNDMSEASREHNSRWINELWRAYEQRVTENRNLEADAIASYIRNISRPPEENPDSPAEMALQAGLVDQLVSRVEVRQLLAEKVGESDDGQGYDAIAYQEYRQATVTPMPEQKKAIGLIVAAGSILSGEQPNGMIGSASLTELIRQARDDDDVQALVIRVNSGGGSAFASEVIRKEILDTRAQGKPVYISMGSVAASGGYWIASAADEIWATPTTITGSIGVWGLLPNLSEAFPKLGIHSDGIGTTPLADLYHPDRPLSDAASNFIQSGVNDIYRRFLNIVAEARDSDPASVHEIAEGRVWTGNFAKGLGLVDKLGSLNEVIAAAAAANQIDDYRVKVIKRKLSLSDKIMRTLLEEVKVPGMASWASRMQQDFASLAAPLTPLRTLLLSLQGGFTEGQQAEVMAVCLECYGP